MSYLQLLCQRYYRVVVKEQTMSPNLEENPIENVPLHPSPILSQTPSPLSSLTQSDEELDFSLSSAAAGDELNEPTTLQVVLPLEYNLRELLVKVSATESLESLTQIKLRVISHEVSLQNIYQYVPSLRELILDGSVILSLREIGSELKNLKTLRVNHCSLTNFDGIFSLENLEELYAADNFIENAIPCAFLSNLRIIDLRRNLLKNILNTLGFWSLCENLEHVNLEGNNEIQSLPNYRRNVKSLLPTLKTLDGICLNEDLCNNNGIDIIKETFKEANMIKSPRNRLNVPTLTENFTVTFPPRVCLFKALEGQLKPPKHESENKE